MTETPETDTPPLAPRQERSDRPDRSQDDVAPGFEETDETVSGGSGAPVDAVVESGSVAAAGAQADTLPFTGSRVPLMLLVAVGLLGLGVGLRTVSAERG